MTDCERCADRDPRDRLDHGHVRPDVHPGLTGDPTPGATQNLLEAIFAPWADMASDIDAAVPDDWSWWRFSHAKTIANALHEKGYRATEETP